MTIGKTTGYHKCWLLDDILNRMKMRPMGLSLVGAFDPMLRGQKIADLIATCAAIDVVIPDIDR